MPLTPGDKLGPYEILAPLGEGGMGEVYKARDPRLERTVALKVSKTEFNERFEREARAVAALNHPNICQIYDVGPNYLVMELVDGEPLKGPLPVDKAVVYAGQILDALDAAHKKGIVHRDLKPANILVTGQRIKLLDFGLAKQTAPLQETDATVVAGLTGQGQILGTLQYMAPEQLQGGTADTRSDIFAFGCVLYEMLSGKRAFSGANAASVIGAILHQRPEPLQTEPPLERVILRCLQKDPDDRFQTARDLKYNIGLAMEPLVTAATASRKWIYAPIAAAAVIVTGAILLFTNAPSRSGAVSFPVNLVEGMGFTGDIQVSPDGRYFAFGGAKKDSRRQLFLRRLDSAEINPLTGTSGVQFFTWSTDSKEIAFYADKKMKRLNLGTGVIRELPIPFDPDGFDWGEKGTILFSTSTAGPLQAVSDSGASSTTATQLDLTSGEIAHKSPRFCSDGKHFLFEARYSDQHRGLQLGSLGSDKHTSVEGALQSVCTSGASTAFGNKNFLLEIRDESLTAREFDTSSAKLSSEFVVLAKGKQFRGVATQLSSSHNGIICFRTFQFSAGKLTWHDRAGKVLETLPEAAVGISPTLSGDDQILATSKLSSVGGEIWITDLRRNSSMRLILGQDAPNLPVLSDDGSRVVFASPIGLYEAESAGTAPPRLLGKVFAWPQQYSPDGKGLLYVDGTKRELMQMPLQGEPTPISIAPQGSTYFPASYSPDGRLVTYTSTESGRPEVYVRAVSPGTGKWMISTDGGGMSFWRGDGKELFFLGADLKMRSVDIKFTPSFQIGESHVLFQTAVPGINNGRNNYVVTKDGKRFLIYTTPEGGEAGAGVIVNWPALRNKE